MEGIRLIPYVGMCDKYHAINQIIEMIDVL
jgi:hypothetical protein